MFIVRYADDFRIFCRNKDSAERTMKAVVQWLKERLKLDVSPEKTRIVNLKRQYSEFLGIKMKVEKKSNKYLIKSHICDKALKKIKKESREAIKKIQHAKDGEDIIKEMNRHNLQIVGWHNYYEMASMVSSDLSKVAFSIKIRMNKRLNALSIKKQPNYPSQSSLVKRYGKSKQARYFGDFMLVPLAYVKTKPPMCRKKNINKYTVEGRATIHKGLKFSTAIMYQMMKQRLFGRSIEFMDNRVSLYCSQHGKCAITGKWFDSAHEIYCHHKLPKHLGGKDNYENLTLICENVHILIHATKVETIAIYIKKLGLKAEMIQKINVLRKMSGNKEIAV